LNNISNNPNITLSKAVSQWILPKIGHTMTSFVHLEYSNQHPGVARVEAAIASAQQIKRSFSGTRGLATLLLSAIAAAVMVVAYQVMDSMAEGHLLVLWIGLWAVAFATLAICASTARAVASKLKASLDGWSRNLAARRADARLWAMAKTDARVMADLQCAMSRGDFGDEGLRFVRPAAAKAAAASRKAMPSGMGLAQA
jgi:hypothetical protein